MAYPSVYVGRIRLTDIRGNHTTLEYSIDTPTNLPFAALDLAAAQDHITDLVAQLGALSTANVTQAGVFIRTVDNATLGDAGSDVTNEAAIVVYVNPTGELEKTHVLRIPSPVNALFESDLVTVDLDNADLNTYIDEIDAGVFISDGEQINDALGTNGMKEGYWRSKARTVR